MTYGVNINVEQAPHSAEKQEVGRGPRSPDSRSQWGHSLSWRKGRTRASPSLEDLEEHPSEGRGASPEVDRVMSLFFTFHHFFPISFCGDETILKNAPRYKIKPESHDWASQSPP